MQNVEAMVRVKLTTSFPAAMVGRMSTTIFRLCAVIAMRVNPLLRETRLRQGYVLDVLGQSAGTQERHDMCVEEGDHALNKIIDTTRVQLHRYREAGISDEDFILRLRNEFIGLRKQMSSDAGSLQMALSCYRMALLTDYIAELEEKLEFQRAAVDFLLELDDLETI